MIYYADCDFARITDEYVGSNSEYHATVITFDMALHEKAVTLLDTRSDLKRVFVPRLGELNPVMVAPRALGVSTEK